MSILSENIEPQITYVGHLFDVDNRTYKHGFPTHYGTNNGSRQHPNFSCLKGLLGFRNSHNAYVKAFEKYIVAAFLTCYVNPSGVHVCDDRFNKIIRMVNKVYGLPMGSLEVEFDLNPGRLRMWHKDQGYAGWTTSIIDFKLSTPMSYGVKVDPYYELKPSAIKTHLMATERLLNYDVENDILVNKQ